MKRLIAILSGVLLLSAAATAMAAGGRSANSTDPPIGTWNAPMYYTAPASGRTALTDGAPPMPYIPLVPCRQYDSRSSSALADNTPRTVTLSGAPCGVPASARAAAVNITVFNIVASANAVFKVDTVSPPVIAWINYPPTEAQRANAGVVGLNGSAAIVVQVNQGGGSVDFVVDVFGYYGPSPANSSNYFTLTNNSTGYTMYLTNASTTCSGACGLYASTAHGDAIYGYTSSSSSGDAAVQGFATTGMGVQGSSTSTYGVRGSSSSSNGVLGTSTGAGVAGVLGQNTNNTSGSHGVGGYASGTGTVFGVQGQISASAAAGSAGVHGIGASATGASYAMLGETSDNTADSAAIMGQITGAGAIQGIGTGWVPSGIRGQAFDTGVWGFANTYAVFGRSYTTAGVSTAYGILGRNSGTTTYGVYGGAGGSGTTNWGVYSSGNMGASGTKPFVEPHPYRPDLVIRYVALEGPEAGTYFRGRGRFVGREAVIEVPEDFRLVSDVDGLSIQVTPIGDFSQVAVVSMGLDFIELKATRDVEFFYHVNGVRKTFKDWKVVVSSNEFAPDGPSAKMPEGLSDEQRRSLIRNGTYNPDGTVNMTTARRLGWDVEWSRHASQDLGKVAPKTDR